MREIRGGEAGLSLSYSAALHSWQWLS